MRGSPLPTSALKSFCELPWKSSFVARLPGDPEARNFTRNVQEVCYSKVAPTPVREPKLVGWSEPLAAELGIARPSADDSASLNLLAGNCVLPSMQPYAARYGGHQFGHWAGQLGDGRAITLGEVATPSAEIQEFQLKGAGPTPYSRRADGRAVLRSSVREFLCSEAMHHLGVPTTRALSLVLTGDPVTRDMFYDGNPQDEPGAIVCRVAPSFLRFGNFQILAESGEIELLKKLTDLLITDHYSELEVGHPDVYGLLFDEVCRRTAKMIAHWMRVGFVHGVMNTDNMSVLGLTIDYGPYGWIEPYDPGWTPNTTDAQGRRYRFGTQPNIALWNLARLAEAWYPLIQNEERIHLSLNGYRDTFASVYGRILSQKLGLTLATSSEPFSGLSEEESSLVEEMFRLMHSVETDMTIFFRALSDWRRENDFFEAITPAFYTPDRLPPQLRDEWKQWSIRYSACLERTPLTDEQRSLSMKAINPKYVLRNYLAQNAITAAEKGDLSVLERLQRVLKTPYDELPGDEDLAAKRPDWARNAPGCSALSCSS